MLAAVVRHVKHWVLDAAYPPPAVIHVHAGVHGVEHHIVSRVVCDMDVDSLVWETASGPPRVYFEEMEEEVTGCFAVCRYVGRLQRLYPTHPRNAMYVDSLLEALQEAVHRVRHDGTTTTTDVVVRAMASLEDTFPTDGSAWLHGFDAMTVADTCWCAFFEWCVTEGAVDDLPWHAHPRLHMWWMQLQGVVRAEPVEKNATVEGNPCSSSHPSCASPSSSSSASSAP